ncbi:MAG: hypothetical protein U1D06_05570, partial [Paracoccaceae bacterium]|nr:hypothetical protein [Paracoccaceae bacterium]
MASDTPPSVLPPPFPPAVLLPRIVAPDAELPALELPAQPDEPAAFPAPLKSAIMPAAFDEAIPEKETAPQAAKVDAPAAARSDPQGSPPYGGPSYGVFQSRT